MIVARLVLLSALAAAHAAPQVNIGRTTLSGRDVGNDIEFFGGIPYAEPPVGALRLRRPLLKSRLNVTSFDARDYGKACLQPVAAGWPKSSRKASCVILDVCCYQLHQLHSNLPSISHGLSDMVAGSLLELLINQTLMGTPIILATFNYRVGPLGFPQGQEAGNQKSLNLGILDEIAALEWVQANIGSFGGDKRKVILCCTFEIKSPAHSPCPISKVTIFGESAGAGVTSILFLDPGLGKLARAGIMESGGTTTFPTFTAERNELAWQTFVGNVTSCAAVADSGNTFACLRNATTEQITAALLQTVTLNIEEIFGGVPWVPTLDGPGGVIPDLPSRLYSKGHFAKLPFISGTNLDEGTLFAYQTPTTTQQLQGEFVRAFSPSGNGSAAALETVIARLLELYPEIPSLGSPYGTGDELFGLPASYKRHASILGDLAFDSARRLWAQVAAKAGVKGYGYLFAHPQPQDPPRGTFHSSEIPFVFGLTPSGADQATRDLSTVMMDFWISFADSLNPNDGKGAQRAQWPPYTASDNVLLQLVGGNTTTIKDDYRSDQIGFILQNARILQH
ncbi:hypothetical protein MD484_g4188, partial [Candolleomyces efflorescens]